MKINIPEVTSKSALRKLYYQLLQNNSKNNIQNWSKIICKNFEQSHYFKQNHMFALYNALPYEMATKELIELLWSHAKQVCLPRMNGDELEFYLINNWDEITIDNNFNIAQPLATCFKVKPINIDCMIIPMIAFDVNYYRIGHGKGYYDSFLTKKNIKCQKIGMAFAMQKIPFAIEHDSWDIPLDFIFTN
ncbi:5-formyltetrahydrofolate cyclo-ligase [Spiroplasma sp. AdecLV25b]|uniref:5-formyltetrahydrofolate cyclo-ligase n=1 Tax=Spiroplasma sp. AdecLV25b TaxID=3027162 RepID=UPI0027E1A9AD|nr:5-formyltetrahydrofolate cyclo-ligase [Spiroplasma sp. AdecLV25b]